MLLPRAGAPEVLEGGAGGRDRCQRNGLEGEETFGSRRNLSAREGESATRPNIFTGTSGYSYEDWRGLFYPARLAKERMLEYTPASFPSPRSTPFLYIPPCGW
ncbi:MAG: hypothetical protein AB1426_12670 [Bacillota bacterium]